PLHAGHVFRGFPIHLRYGLPGCSPPLTDRTKSPRPQRAFTSRLPAVWSPSLPLDMTTTWTGRLVLAGLAPAYLGHWCQAEIFGIADCIFCGSCDGVGVINGSFAIAANSGKCAGRPRFCHCGKDRINLSPVRSSGP